MNLSNCFQYFILYIELLGKIKKKQSARDFFVVGYRKDAKVRDSFVGYKKDMTVKFIFNLKVMS